MATFKAGDKMRDETPRKRTVQPKKTHVPRYGEGSFYYRESDGRWCGVIEAGYTARGTRRRIKVSDANENKAWQKFNAKRKEVQLEGMPSESVSVNTTVQGWITTWLEDRQHRVKPKTYSTDSGVLRKWVVPVLGTRRLHDLEAADLRKVAAHMRKEGKSDTTIRYVHRVFQQCLMAAVSEGHKVPQAALAARKPEGAASARSAMPIEEARKIRAEAQKELRDTRWEFALMTATRQGEALGLTWDCLDLEKGIVRIEWELQELTRDKTTGSYIVPKKYKSRQLVGRFWLIQPKTAAGARVIPLPRALCDRLEAWRESGPKSPYDLVWCRPDGLPVIGKKDLADWRALQSRADVWKDREAGKQYLGHEIRHTTVSLLLALGVPIPVIEAIVGHSKLVKDYVHISDAQAREGIDMYDTKLLEA